MVQDFLLNHYLWVKALHIIAIIAWMAGLLYLPRLFVYHAEAGFKGKQHDVFVTMEQRLLGIIMRPAMIASWLFGFMLLYANTALMSQGWMHAKLTLVVLMTGAHHVFQAWAKKFRDKGAVKSPRFYKIANEAPTVLMIAIVILAIVEPF